MEVTKQQTETVAASFLRKATTGGGAAIPAEPVHFARWLHQFFRRGNLGVDISHGTLSKEEAQAALRDIWEKFGRVT